MKKAMRQFSIENHKGRRKMDIFIPGFGQPFKVYKAHDGWRTIDGDRKINVSALPPKPKFLGLYAKVIKLKVSDAYINFVNYEESRQDYEHFRKCIESGCIEFLKTRKKPNNGYSSGLFG